MRLRTCLARISTGLLVLLVGAALWLRRQRRHKRLTLLPQVQRGAGKGLLAADLVVDMQSTADQGLQHYGGAR